MLLPNKKKSLKCFFVIHFIICKAYSIVRKHNDKTVSLLRTQPQQWLRIGEAHQSVVWDIYSPRHIRLWWWWWHCTGRVPLLIYCLRQSNHGWRPPRWASQRHPILHFTIQATEKYSTAMYYAPPHEHNRDTPQPARGHKYRPLHCVLSRKRWFFYHILKQLIHCTPFG